jgi:hypothetical protein
MAASTFSNRRLTIGNTPRMVRSLPEDWPHRTGQRLIVDPPALLSPEKTYRVALDLERGTATISEDTP